MATFVRLVCIVKTFESLREYGYAMLPGFLKASRVAQLIHQVEQLYEAEGASAGSEFRQEPNCRRLANLVDKGPLFRALIGQPQVLELIGFVLGPEYKLSSLNARSADPNSDSAQPLHSDMGAIPDKLGFWVCNTVWMLDDFIETNGALRVVPGTHRAGKLPPRLDTVHPDEKLVTGTAGTVVVMNAHLWHGGSANRTSSPRRAIHGFYCRSDKPQQQYQKALLKPETVASLTRQERKILALDDPANDLLSADRTIARSGFLPAR